MKADQERVVKLLTDTITLLCKNGLIYDSELTVQGLLGITLDKNDVFIVHINETLNASSSTVNTTPNVVKPKQPTPNVNQASLTSSAASILGSAIVDLTKVNDQPASNNNNSYQNPFSNETVFHANPIADTRTKNKLHLRQQQLNTTIMSLQQQQQQLQQQQQQQLQQLQRSEIMHQIQQHLRMTGVLPASTTRALNPSQSTPPQPRLGLRTPMIRQRCQSANRKNPSFISQQMHVSLVEEDDVVVIDEEKNVEQTSHTTTPLRQKQGTLQQQHQQPLSLKINQSPNLTNRASTNKNHSSNVIHHSSYLGEIVIEPNLPLQGYKVTEVSNKNTPHNNSNNNNNNNNNSNNNNSTEAIIINSDNKNDDDEDDDVLIAGEQGGNNEVKIGNSNNNETNKNNNNNNNNDEENNNNNIMINNIVEENSQDSQINFETVGLHMLAEDDDIINITNNNEVVLTSLPSVPPSSPSTSSPALLSTTSSLPPPPNQMTPDLPPFLMAPRPSPFSSCKFTNCNFSSVDSISLAEHYMESHSNSLDLSVKDPKFVTNSGRHGRGGKELGEGFKSPECEMKWGSMNSLEAHLQNDHIGSASNSEGSNENNFNCNYQDPRQENGNNGVDSGNDDNSQHAHNSLTTSDEHVAMETSEDVDNSRQLTTNSDNIEASTSTTTLMQQRVTKTYICIDSTCTFSCDTKDNLLEHMKLVHNFPGTSGLYSNSTDQNSIKIERD